MILVTHFLFFVPIGPFSYVLSHIYNYICVQIFFVIERTRDLIYLKLVETDFFPKIISLGAGENSSDLA